MSKKIIVSKFGGTSLADAPAIRQSALVAKNNEASIVVVSATSGTTNELVELAGCLTKTSGGDAAGLVKGLRLKHEKIADDLELSAASKKRLDEQLGALEKLAMSILKEAYASVLKEIYPETRQVYKQRIKSISYLLDEKKHAGPTMKRQTKQIADRILSFGEQFSAILICDALNKLGIAAEIIDARDVLKTDDNHKYATPLLGEIKKQSEKILVPKLGKDKVLVTQGFVGRAPDGSTTTLGRGGSDYSAALLAEAVKADELQIWSDVPGIATADPRVVENTRHISHLTFQEAAELATAGAKILYPKTIAPVRRSDIALFVGNTFKPDEAGTRIERSSSNKPLITALSLKPKQSLVTLSSERMAQEFGYLAKVFSIFAKHKTSVDQVSTSEISIAFTLDGYISSHERMLDELRELGDVTIENGMSLISLIGNDINNTPGLAGKIFSCLETKDSKIAVRMICQGASKHNFCFIVEGKYGEASVKKLHKEFIEKG